MKYPIKSVGTEAHTSDFKQISGTASDPISHNAKVFKQSALIHVSDVKSAREVMVRSKDSLGQGEVSKVSASEATQGVTGGEINAHLNAIWRTEIEALKGKNFSSVKEAAKTVAKRVIERLPANPVNAAEEERFITNFLLKDEKIVAKLKESLKIS